MTAYPIVLLLHSWVRWLVLLSGLGALVTFWRGALAEQRFSAVESRAMRLFLGVLDTQVLLGLLLYFVFSPLGLPRAADFPMVMKNTVLRYFAVEHWFGMLMALVAAHGLWVWAKRGPVERRRARALWAVGVTLLLIVVMIPWPGTPYGRSFFRLP
jgi:hypothetical protein